MELCNLSRSIHQILKSCRVCVHSLGGSRDLLNAVNFNPQSVIWWSMFFLLLPRVFSCPSLVLVSLSLSWRRWSRSFSAPRPPSGAPCPPKCGSTTETWASCSARCTPRTRESASPCGQETAGTASTLLRTNAAWVRGTGGRCVVALRAGWGGEGPLLLWGSSAVMKIQGK